MPQDREVIYAASREDALEQVYNLYPTATEVEIESRRNAEGHYSAFGHTFIVNVNYQEEPGEFEDFDSPDDLGEEEY